MLMIFLEIYSEAGGSSPYYSNHGRCFGEFENRASTTDKIDA